MKNNKVIQKKDSGACCPACESGIHDCTESYMYHRLIKCDCACNVNGELQEIINRHNQTVKDIRLGKFLR